ncbi:energy transducer TonB [Roseomonas elaeocarpi]|uniref:Energy transducer TonB n=1 Tax=Roseomonas elaeocarpi TaxID=907779 RepID=A0ABV6JTR7_9PROT
MLRWPVLRLASAPGIRPLRPPSRAAVFTLSSLPVQVSGPRIPPVPPRRGRPWPAPLSLALHGAVAAALVFLLHQAEPPRAPLQLRGVPLLWAGPGEGSNAPTIGEAPPPPATAPDAPPPSPPPAESQAPEAPPPVAPDSGLPATPAEAPPAEAVPAPPPIPPAPAAAEATIPPPALVPPVPAPPDKPGAPNPAPVALPRPPPPAPPPPVPSLASTPATPQHPPSRRQDGTEAAASSPLQINGAVGGMRLGAGVGGALGETRGPGAPRDGCAQNIDYPPEQRRLGITGAVALRLRLTDTGRVVEARVVNSSGVAALDDWARERIRRCRFTPGIRDGHPVWSSYDTTIYFDRN